MTDHVEIDGYRFLGWGPSATAPGGRGWHMAEDFYARCSSCGDLMRLWPDESEQCQCGRLYKDVDAGRFGSSDGDSGIAIYRQTS